jgi:hypothetical protein
MLGISKSYRPTQEEAKTPAERPMSKEDMKRYFPDMYDDLYGPGGSLYDFEEARREEERLEREELQREKDLMYGYQGGTGGTVWSKEKKKKKGEEGESVWNKEEQKGGTIWGGGKKKGGTVWSEKE